MDREGILRKIRACLRLAGSANPHEAAAALRQARALMDKHGLSAADAAGLTSASAPTRGRGAMVPDSIICLAQIIAEGNRCRALFRLVSNGHSGTTCVEFHGVRTDAQVSAYAFTVLRRLLEASKSEYLIAEERGRRRKWPAARRKHQGELFSLGWVAAVGELFPKADISVDHERSLQLALKQAGAEVATTKQDRKTKERTPSQRFEDFRAQAAGFNQGSGVRLHRGVGQEASSASAPAIARLEARA